jgi:hypothetical protein
MMILKNYDVHPVLSSAGEELIISAGNSCSEPAPTGGLVAAPTMAPSDMSGSAALFGMASYFMGSPVVGCFHFNGVVSLCSCRRVRKLEFDG